jgi:hypothetical protein
MFANPISTYKKLGMMVLCKKHKKEDHGPDQSRQKSKILFKADN